MFYKIAELSIKSSKNTNKNSDVFIAQPSADKEKLAGKLFIIVEIDSKMKITEKIIEFLVNDINTSYYQNEKILFREKLQNLKVEHIFEASLTKVNKNFSNFSSKEKFGFGIDKINITAGIIHENNIHFANSGKNKILLVHKIVDQFKKTTDSQDKNEKSTYKISDITKQSGNSQQDITKLFSNVISGKIPKKGVFVISNEALPEYISNKQMIDITSALPPFSAIEQIKQILTKTNFYISFSAILLKNTTLEKREEGDMGIKSSAQESISSLNQTEDKTEDLLSPSGIINIKKWVKLPKVFSSISKKQSQLTDFSLKDKIFTKKRQSILVKIKLILKKLFELIFNILHAVLSIFFGAKDSAGGKNKITASFKKLSLKRKVLISVFGIFSILFIFSISSTKIEERKIERQENYSKLKDEIEQKQNKAEANLLYSNEEGAKNLFNEIEDLIKDYPQETDAQIEEFEEYKNILKQNLEKIQKITRIDNLKELVNFKNLNQGANPENLIYVKTDKSIYSTDSTQKAIYSFETENNLATLAANIEGQFSSLKSPAKTSGNSLYFFDNNNIVQYSIGGKATVLNIELSGSYLDSSSMIDVYNDRLYILNTKENNIHRHNRLASSFGSAYSWANKSIDLSDSVDLSIDGHIFILKNNGEVLRLLRGEETEWKIESIEPPLTSPTNLIVSPESNFIYILEKSTNRIVVFDKEGQFIAQYKSNTFSNLKDFTIDEDNKKIYVLDNSSIYAINVIHLEEKSIEQ